MNSSRTYKQPSGYTFGKIGNILSNVLLQPLTQQNYSHNIDFGGGAEDG